ncbi:hypothetical protein NPIL_349841 [Nephila pilipes]|uniref:Uncharacterized protein n=1 Tax=Nephila pilipes TaxID=299642 RepID=A0A8X6Q913_NEPPI|nr:hypothetical protein NPIL_349841 [Nephila pilipes]
MRPLHFGWPSEQQNYRTGGEGWRSLLSKLHRKISCVVAISSHGVFGYFHRWNSWRANYRKFLGRVHPFLHGHDLVQVIGLCRMGRPHRTADVFSGCSMSILAIESLG